MAARESYRVTSGTSEGQRYCARDQWCSAQTRDDEGIWHPARIQGQPVCMADRSKVITDAEALPEAYRRLAEKIGDPARSGRAIRIPPGSRVLVSPDIEALLRDIAVILGGWAARVRAVPGLQLAPNQHPHGTAAAVAADCGVLAAHPDPLLALPPGPMFRTWTFPAAKPGALRPSPVPCSRCGLPLSATTVKGGKRRWWPAVCTHRLVSTVLDYREDDEGKPYTVVTGWTCQACGDRFADRPGRRPACRHQAAGGATAAPGGIPAGILAEIGDLEIVYAGDGWVTVVTDLGGAAAGLDIIDLHRRAVRLLGENPAPADILEGVPCRACEAMSALSVLEKPPPDPAKPPPLFCKCVACHDVMTRKEYDAWVDMYAAWTRGSGRLTCRRCDLGFCRDCCWDSCTCCRGHAAA